MVTEDLKCKNQDRFPKEIINIFIIAANYVLENSVFRKFSEDEIKNWWRNRSLRDIIERNKDPKTNLYSINHLFPCIDTSIIAAHYLRSNSYRATIKMFTEQGAFEEFRKGNRRIMHIDSVCRLEHKKKIYFLDIGCGDLTFGVLRSRENPEETYLTTRHETNESFWKRTPIAEVSGIGMYPITQYQNYIRTPSQFLNRNINQVKVPYGITVQDLRTEKAFEGKKSVFELNLDYNPEESRRYNKEWLGENKDFLKGLKEFRYQ